MRYILQVFEERPNYDLTQFVADMGGSLGFLLGLSVLGLIKILEKVLKVVKDFILLWENKSQTIYTSQSNSGIWKLPYTLKETTFLLN